MKFRQIRSATSIVTFGGRRFLIDPMLSPANTYPPVPDAPVSGQGNPTYDLPCEVETLFDVDAIIVTHWHFDHFDDLAMKILPKNHPLFLQSEEEAALAAEKGFTDTRILAEEGSAFFDVFLYKTPCDHGRTDPVTLRAYREMGITEKASGVVFASHREKSAFYLAGDSVYFPGIDDTIEKFAPQVIAVNAAGAQYPLGHPILMNQYDILALMRAHPDPDVIATHVDGVSHATVSRTLLRQFRQDRDLEKLHIPDDLEELHF